MLDHNEVLDKVLAIVDRGQEENLILPQIRGRLERLRDELNAGVDEVVEEAGEAVDEVESLADRIAAAVATSNTSHAQLKDLADEAGLETPEDPKAPWTVGEGDEAQTATTVAEKKDVLANAELPAETPAA